MTPTKAPSSGFNANWIAWREPSERRRILAKLSEKDAEVLEHHWSFWGRPEQLLPEGDWRICLWLAGRGWGKTRTGAEAVRALKKDHGRIALVAPTAADARDVMVEGVSGLLATAPPFDRPVYEPSRRRVTWSNGAAAFLYSAEDPDSLRGPQFDAAWCDELAAWRRLRDTFDMLQFGLRLGEQPRCIVTTTPRPLPLIRELVARPDVCVIRGRTRDNRAHLAAPFLETVVARYGGTRLGRQELDGEILLDVPGALWRRDAIEATRVAAAPELARVVVAVDPPASSGATADECGIVVAGRGADGRFYVLADRSAAALTPQQWANRAVAAYHEFAADRLVAETNQGGEMVEAVVRQIDADMAFRSIRATRGKALRAEPISALYEQGRVSHVGCHPRLEDQMAEFTVTGCDSGSPDRVDALVHAIGDLVRGSAPEPRIRRL